MNATFTPLSVFVTTALLWSVTFSANADIYEWVDANGRVHYSDKRAAKKDAVIVGEAANAITSDGMTFTFVPQADALLSSTQSQPQGKASVLSAGYWTANDSTLATKSLLQFDIGALLKELNTQKHKHLANATLELYANTQDKLYGQGITNRESPGHSTLRGDNAFYLKPVHSDWDENTVYWSEFYTTNIPIPAIIRQLPSVSVPGSEGIPDKNYLIDVTELMAALILAQQREISLEMSPQRTSAMAQVTFFSREGDPQKIPRLIVNLK